MYSPSHFLRQYYLPILAVLLFMAHQLSEPFIELSIIDSYLDDLLFFPVVYGVLVFIFRLFMGLHYRLPIPMMFIGFVLTFFSTEVLFPSISNLHVSDPWDGLAYFSGGFLFHFSTNIPTKA